MGPATKKLSREILSKDELLANDAELPPKLNVVTKLCLRKKEKILSDQLTTILFHQHAFKQLDGVKL